MKNVKFGAEDNCRSCGRPIKRDWDPDRGTFQFSTLNIHLCPACEKKWHKEADKRRNSPEYITEKCARCGGKGRVMGYKCMTCYGKGTVKKKKYDDTLDFLHVDPGWENK